MMCQRYFLSNATILLWAYCRTGFDSDGLTVAKISLKSALESTFIITYIGVVFSFMGSLSLDRYHLDFLMILKEILTFLSLSNLVLHYVLQIMYLPQRWVRCYRSHGLLRSIRPDNSIEAINTSVKNSMKGCRRPTLSMLCTKLLRWLSDHYDR